MLGHLGSGLAPGCVTFREHSSLGFFLLKAYANLNQFMDAPGDEEDAALEKVLAPSRRR